MTRLLHFDFKFTEAVLQIFGISMTTVPFISGGRNRRSRGGEVLSDGEICDFLKDYVMKTRC